MNDLILLEAGLAALLAILVLAFGSRFASSERTERALACIARNQRLFRAGALLIVIGMVVTAEADAVRWMGDLALDDLRYRISLTAGYVLIIGGVTAIVGSAVARGRPS